MDVETRPLLSGRIAELDGLRRIAIFLVLVSHYFVFQIQIKDAQWLAPFAPFLNLAWSGLDLFFVLSGFLIGGILMGHRHHY